MVDECYTCAQSQCSFNSEWLMYGDLCAVFTSHRIYLESITAKNRSEKQRRRLWYTRLSSYRCSGQTAYPLHSISLKAFSTAPNQQRRFLCTASENSSAVEITKSCVCFSRLRTICVYVSKNRWKSMLKNQWICEHTKAHDHGMAAKPFRQDTNSHTHT